MNKLRWLTKACGVFLLWATAGVTLPAQTFTSLYSFDGTDGSLPLAALVQGTDGNFYGTTYEGGANGDGTVFKITPSGALTTLYNFCSQINCTDGRSPASGLVQGTDGTLYGTTYDGGAVGVGTAFKITPSGALTTLLSFYGYSEGGNPKAGLVQGTDGDFYGTTYDGGASGYGTVFKITPSGTLATLLSFDYADGANPQAVLVQGTNGDFYGTTSSGGIGGYGTVFKITPSGTLTTLHNFGRTDGYNLHAGLVQGTNGTFYGTTEEGGANDDGTIFSVTPSGTLTILHTFEGTDGANPYAGLFQGTNGEFYGATYAGGQRRWHSLQPKCRTGPVCGNTAYLGQGGGGGQNPGKLSDWGDQRHL
jgi:uncharacterized repeat protein (TIGR03803 family)